MNYHLVPKTKKKIILKIKLFLLIIVELIIQTLYVTL